MKIHEQASPKGHYSALTFPRDLTENEIERVRTYTRTGEQSTLRDIPLLHIYQIHNIVPDTGANVLARRLGGNTTYPSDINYGALGSGTTAFDNNTTQLNTEVYRKAPSDTGYDGRVSYIDWFIASGDVADQTFEEFGAFIDGTASADSGQLFSATITGGWEKTGSMFIALRVTF